MNTQLSRVQQLVCLMAIAGVAGLSAFSSYLSRAQSPPTEAPTAYHTIHPKEWFAPEQCASCHTTPGSKSPQLTRTSCEICHNLAMYPDHQPDYAQKPMACLWCHGRTESIKISLHMIPQHQDCKSCHDDRHTGQKPLRAQCIACHQNRKLHEPDAPVCYGCHLFSSSPIQPDPVANGAPVFTPEPTGSPGPIGSAGVAPFLR